MFNTPVRYFRPTNADGSEAPSTPHGVLWVDPVVQDNQQMVLVDYSADVVTGDILQVPHNTFEE